MPFNIYFPIISLGIYFSWFWWIVYNNICVTYCSSNNFTFISCCGPNNGRMLHMLITSMPGKNCEILLSTPYVFFHCLFQTLVSNKQEWFSEMKIELLLSDNNFEKEMFITSMTNWYFLILHIFILYDLFVVWRNY